MHHVLFLAALSGCWAFAALVVHSDFSSKMPSGPAELSTMLNLLAADVGATYAHKLSEIENRLLRHKIFAKANSPHFAYSRFKTWNPEPRAYGEKAMRLIQATELLRKQGLTEEALRRSSARFSFMDNACIPVPECKPSKYRSIDGSCNNLHQPLMGKSLTTYRRLRRAGYSDRIKKPRMASDGSSLPSARLVATTVFPDADVIDSKMTLSVMQWGQFIDHDFALAPHFQFGDGTDIECCSETGDILPPDLQHPACFPIPIPADDAFYRQFNRSCINFVRSMPGPTNTCFLGHAEQLNELTHWLDGSQVYGSNDEVANILREFQGGRLKILPDSNGRHLLPIYPIPCNKTNGAPCFFAGDSRVEETPLLTVMHTLLVREHNRVARGLAKLNPSWPDEITFQEARRIVVAEMQHITYTEWLPLLLSTRTLLKYGLVAPNLKTTSDKLTFFESLPNMIDGIKSLSDLRFGLDTSNFYSSEVDAAVSTEFATAAFRMGHTLLPGFIKIYGRNGYETDLSFSLSSHFNNPLVVQQEPAFFDGAIRSLLTQNSQKLDQHISSELNDRLFRNVNLGHQFGLSLPALNIQRGRDHGIAGYNSYRKTCGLGKAKEFSDLTNIAKNMVAKLRRLYKSVDDVDLFVGGLLELPEGGGRMGQTFECIIGDQFARWMKGDRFFYKTRGQSHSFTTAQLEEIRKSSLARIYCDNSDGTIRRVQAKAFLPASESNPQVSCANIPRMDLAKWRNEPVSRA